MPAYSPSSLNAASDEENPAQLEKPLNPPTSHGEPFAPAAKKWVAAPARRIDVSSQDAVPVAATDLPIMLKLILLVWLCLVTFINSGLFVFTFIIALRIPVFACAPV